MEEKTRAEKKKELDKKIEEFLKNGGKITKYPPCHHSKEFLERPVSTSFIE